LSYRGIPMDQNKSHSVHPKKQFSSKPFYDIIQILTTLSRITFSNLKSLKIALITG